MLLFRSIIVCSVVLFYYHLFWNWFKPLIKLLKQSCGYALFLCFVFFFLSTLCCLSNMYKAFFPLEIRLYCFTSFLTILHSGNLHVFSLSISFCHHYQSWFYLQLGSIIISYSWFWKMWLVVVTRKARVVWTILEDFLGHLALPSEFQILFPCNSTWHFLYSALCFS